MKKIVFPFFLFVNASLFSQTTCCAKIKATDEFAMFTQNKKFVAAHEEPLPFILASPAGKIISFTTDDGKKGNGYEVGDPKNNKVIFVIHEWWGLNDYIKQESEKISKETGARVIALDLYDKKIASSRDSASKYMSDVKTERVRSIIRGAINYVGKDAKIATIGWCFGGGWSMQASLMAGNQAKACVIYYGMPEENITNLTKLNAPVMFVFAQKDEWINKDVVAKFEENMKTAGKTLTVKRYNAEHAFANPSNPHYERSFSEDAFINAKAFIIEHLK